MSLLYGIICKIIKYLIYIIITQVYTFNGYHDLDYPTYLDDALRLGAYDENRIGVEDGLNYHIIDLTWDTPYDPEQNSHGNFINTDVLNVLEDSVSDLDRFNKLKENIYYQYKFI